MASERTARLSYILTAALACAAYLPSLGNGFTLDDRVDIVENPAMLPPAGWGRFLYDASSQSADPVIAVHKWRPLASLSYALNVWALGYNPFWFHLVNVLLHAACSCLVLALARRRLGPGWPAAAAAALFCLHPAQVESVANATMRAGPLSTLFCLAAFLVRADGERGRRAAALACFALGLLAKESAAFLPVVVALDEAARPSGGPDWRRGLRRSAPYWTVLAVYLAARWAAVGRLSHQGPWGGDWGLQAAYAAHGLLGDLRILTLTTPLSICYTVREGPGFLPLAAAGAAAVLALAALAVRGLARGREWGFALAWLLAGLLPVAGAAPMVTISADRFLYPSLVGAGLLFGLLLRRAPRAALPLAAALLAAAALRGAERQLDWDDNLTLNFAAHADRPGDPCGAFRLASSYADWGMLERARELARPAVAPGQRMTAAAGRLLLGFIELKAGRCGLAETYARDVLRASPGRREARWLLERCGRP